ncbi:MAG: chemotaxis protein CheB [Asticcacaulis sp.]
MLYSRPAIDILFETAADAYGAALIGVVLTGANADGANGLKAIAEAGGTTLVQTPELAYADAMPRAALATAPASLSLAPDAIADHLIQAVRR